MAEWTPPTDAVASNDNTEWTPPTDATLEGEVAKKNIPVSQSTSDGSLSESTEGQSAYSPQSISKKIPFNPVKQIKEENKKALNLERSDVLKQKMAEDLTANPSSAYKNKYIESLSKKGYNADALNQFAESLNIPNSEPTPPIEKYADRYSADLIRPITDWGMDFVEKTKGNIIEGAKGLKEGVEEIGMVPDYKKDIEEGKIDLKSPGEAMTHGTLKTIKGGLDIAFNTIPQAVVFNAAVDAINTTAKKNLSEENAKTVEEATALPFSIASKVADKIGVKPEEGSNSEMLLELANLVVGGAIIHSIAGAGDVVKDIKSIKDLKEISEKSAKGDLTPEEQKGFKEYTDKLKSITIEDLKVKAEEKGTPEAKKVANKIDNLLEENKTESEQLHDKLAELKESVETVDEQGNRIANPSFESLPTDLQKARIEDIQTLENLIKVKEGEDLMNASQESQREASIAEIDDKIATVKKASKDVPSAVKESNDKYIAELEAKKAELSPKEEITKDEIEELQDLEFAADEKIATKEDVLRLNELKSKQDAIQEQGASSVDEYSQGGVSETGGERGPMEPGVEGIKATEENKISSKIQEAKQEVGAQVFPKQEELKKSKKLPKEETFIEEKVRNVKEEISPEKQAFIDKGIEELKKEGNYSEDFQKVYEDNLSKKHDILNQKETDEVRNQPEVDAIRSKGENADSLTKEELESGIEEIDRALEGGKETGISKEMREKQRKELGIEEPAPLDKKTDEHTFEALNKEANKLVEEGDVDIKKLVEDILNEKTKPTDLTNTILNRGVVELGNKVLEAKDELTKARENGDKLAEDAASEKYLESLSDINDIYKALEFGGTQLARGLASMKQSMKQDFSVGSLYSRFKKANGDKPLPKELIARLDDYAAQITELNIRIKAAEELAEAQGKQIKDIQKETPKEKVAKIREKRKDLFDQWKQYRDGTGGPVKNSPLPIGDKDIEFIAKIAATYIHEGYVTTMDAAKQLKQDVKKHMGVKLSDEDITRVFDTEVDGKKVVDNFKNTGIPSSKKSLLDLVNKAEKETKEGVKSQPKKTQSEKEKALIQNTNKSLNDLKVAREKLKRKINSEEGAIEFANRSTSDKIKDGVANVMNVPRSLMASFDFSAPLRQGLVATIAHPTSGWKATKEMFKQFASKEVHENWMVNYKLSPEYELAKKSDLYVADPTEFSLNGKEEEFMSNLAEKIPFIGKGIEMSERAYLGYLNKLRTDVFKNGAELLADQGMTFESHPKEYKALADFVNASTGRGKLPNKTIEDAAPLLSAAFFSPRLIASRINLLNPVYYAKMPPSVRMMALKDMAKFAGFAATVLAMAKAGGADVETDPRSTDFAKIKVGDTRYDVLGGFQQYIRFGSQMITGKKNQGGKIVDITKPNFRGISRGSEILKFARNKLAPTPGMATDFLTGKNTIGEDVTIKKELYDHLLPLQATSAIDEYKNGGMPQVLKTLIPSMFGVGVGTYSNKKSDEQKRKEFMKFINQD